MSRPSPSRTRATYRSCIQACVATLVGSLVSGPVAVALVEATHPQPCWAGPETFARSFHPFQVVPYAGGLLLVFGLSSLLASLHALALRRDRARATLALLFGAVFAAFVCLNYALQTSYVPSLARGYQPADAPLVDALSMSNPKSLAWALELWGWGFAGLATWLLASVFDGTPIERATRAAFVANGLFSVAGTLCAVLEPGWALTRLGLVAFTLWNVLFASMAALALVAMRRRLLRLDALPEAALQAASPGHGAPGGGLIASTIGSPPLLERPLAQPRPRTHVVPGGGV